MLFGISVPKVEGTESVEYLCLFVPQHFIFPSGFAHFTPIQDHMQVSMPLKPLSGSALRDALPVPQVSQADEMPSPTVGRTKEFRIIPIPSTIDKHALQQTIKKGEEQ